MDLKINQELLDEQLNSQQLSDSNETNGLLWVTSSIEINSVQITSPAHENTQVIEKDIDNENEIEQQSTMFVFENIIQYISTSKNGNKDIDITDEIQIEKSQEIINLQIDQEEHSHFEIQNQIKEIQIINDKTLQLGLNQSQMHEHHEKNENESQEQFIHTSSGESVISNDTIIEDNESFKQHQDQSSFVQEDHISQDIQDDNQHVQLNQSQQINSVHNYLDPTESKSSLLSSQLTSIDCIHSEKQQECQMDITKITEEEVKVENGSQIIDTLIYYNNSSSSLLDDNQLMPQEMDPIKQLDIPQERISIHTQDNLKQILDNQERTAKEAISFILEGNETSNFQEECNQMTIELDERVIEEEQNVDCNDKLLQFKEQYDLPVMLQSIENVEDDNQMNANVIFSQYLDVCNEEFKEVQENQVEENAIDQKEPHIHEQEIQYSQDQQESQYQVGRFHYSDEIPPINSIIEDLEILSDEVNEKESVNAENILIDMNSHSNMISNQNNNELILQSNFENDPSQICLSLQNIKEIQQSNQQAYIIKTTSQPEGLHEIVQIENYSQESGIGKEDVHPLENTINEEENVVVQQKEIVSPQDSQEQYAINEKKLQTYGQIIESNSQSVGETLDYGKMDDDVNENDQFNDEKKIITEQIIKSDSLSVEETLYQGILDGDINENDQQLIYEHIIKSSNVGVKTTLDQGMLDDVNENYQLNDVRTKEDGQIHVIQTSEVKESTQIQTEEDPEEPQLQQNKIIFEGNVGQMTSVEIESTNLIQKCVEINTQESKQNIFQEQPNDILPSESGPQQISKELNNVNENQHAIQQTTQHTIQQTTQITPVELSQAVKLCTVNNCESSGREESLILSLELEQQSGPKMIEVIGQCSNDVVLGEQEASIDNISVEIDGQIQKNSSFECNTDALGIKKSPLYSQNQLKSQRNAEKVRKDKYLDDKENQNMKERTSVGKLSQSKSISKQPKYQLVRQRDISNLNECVHVESCNNSLNAPAQQSEDSEEDLIEFLIHLREPYSFKQIQEKFPYYLTSVIKETIEEMKSQNKMQTDQASYIQYMFLSSRVKYSSVRMEYFETSPHILDSAMSSQQEQRYEEGEDTDDSKEESDQSLESPKKNTFDFKDSHTLSTLSEDELISYKKALTIHKAYLEQKQIRMNSSEDLLDKLTQLEYLKQKIEYILNTENSCRSLLEDFNDQECAYTLSVFTFLFR